MPIFREKNRKSVKKMNITDKRKTFKWLMTFNLINNEKNTL